MKLIRPMTVTTGNLTSNVTITETAWTAGTYTTGTQRYVGTDLYEVVATPSTATEPTAGAALVTPTWFLVGKINRWKMFDQIIAGGTVRASPVTVTVVADGVANAVALFGLTATSVSVSVVDAIDGTVYSVTRDLTDNSAVVDYWNWFFEPIVRSTSTVFTDLPTYTDAAVTVSVANAGGSAIVGEMVIGKVAELGITAFGLSYGIRDYSRKERDSFGRAIIQERRFARLVSYDILVPRISAAFVDELIASVRAAPIVYIGDENQAQTIVYGFFSDYGVLMNNPALMEMTLEVEGLV